MREKVADEFSACPSRMCRSEPTASSHSPRQAMKPLADVIVAETVYVLESFYEVPVEEVARLVRSIIAFDPIEVMSTPLLLRSLEVYETHSIDYAEAYLVASAEASEVGKVASFDRAIDRVPTGSRIEP